MSLLGATFQASGNLNTSGAGFLDLTLTSGSPSFGGLSGTGTFKLNLTNATTGSVGFAGTVLNVANGFV